MLLNFISKTVKSTRSVGWGDKMYCTVLYSTVGTTTFFKGGWGMPWSTINLYDFIFYQTALGNYYVTAKGSPKKLDSSLRGGRGKGVVHWGFFFLMYSFTLVDVLLTTKPRSWEGLKALVDCPLRLPYDRYVSAPDVALVGVEVLLQQHRGHLHHPAIDTVWCNIMGTAWKLTLFQWI